MDNLGCNRSTCSKRKPHTPDSSLASSLEELDNLGLTSKKTETSPSTPVTKSSSEKAYMPDKNSKKSAEANFDGNNQNLKYQTKESCPSSSIQSSQSDSQICAFMLEQPPISNANANTYKPYNCCMKCQKQLQSSNNKATTTTTSSLPTTPRKKCTCKTVDVTYSSSSESTVSQHFPVKQKIKPQLMPKPKVTTSANKTIVLKCIGTSRLPVRSKPIDNISSNNDQYYSCGSDESDSEQPIKLQKKLKNFSKDSKVDKNLVILQLLEEVLHLINKDNPVRQRTLKATQEVSTNTVDNNITLPKQPQREANAPPTYINDSNWCPCICCAQVQPLIVPPYIQPYNLNMNTFYKQPQPETVVCRQATEDVFKDCNSSIASNISCNCPNLNLVCPVHGPLKKLVKNPNLIAADSSKTLNNELQITGEEKEIDKLPEEEEEIDKDLYDIAIVETKKAHKTPSKETIRRHTVPDAIETYIDEELEPLYVPRRLSEPAQLYQPGLDSLSIYDDEDPRSSEKEKDEKLTPAIEKIKSSEGDSTRNDEIRRMSITKEIISKDELDREQAANTRRTTVTEENDTEENLSPALEVPSNNIRTSSVFNNLPENDQNNQDDQRQIIRYKGSEEDNSEMINDNEDDNELAKEKRAESCKEKKIVEEDDKEMALATIKPYTCEGSPEEMKFFIDSLILDLDAMEYSRNSRRNSQSARKICKGKSAAICARESFPVTITEVTDLGVDSLYVKWIIHDCCGIGGYEIYTDGCLTNRFFNSKHEAAVITNVDVTMPHKISLVALPSAAQESIELICNIGDNKTTKSKSLPWKTNMEMDRKSLYTLWAPSVYLYSPTVC